MKCCACSDCSWENLSALTSTCLYTIQEKDCQNYAKTYFISVLLDYFSALFFSFLLPTSLPSLLPCKARALLLSVNRKGSVLSHAFSDRLILFRCDFQYCNEIILNEGISKRRGFFPPTSPKSNVTIIKSNTGQICWSLDNEGTKIHQRQFQDPFLA